MARLSWRRKHMTMQRITSKLTVYIQKVKKRIAMINAREYMVANSGLLWEGLLETMALIIGLKDFFCVIEIACRFPRVLGRRIPFPFD